jgi:predicted AAA+ superfamily ATPase
MSGRRSELERIAAALERLAPGREAPVDWLRHPAYLWADGGAKPLASLDALPLDSLKGIEAQKEALLENLARLSAGQASHDVLLWGARGTGKSALVRSAVQHLQENAPGKLALVQVARGELLDMQSLIEELGKQERAFLLFMDDLGFGEQDLQHNLALRSLLDGAVTSRPANIRLVATSNRRAIVKREADEDRTLHERDERDNALALADRFGLTLAFHPCDQATYLEILRSYVDPLGLDFDEKEALAWATARGNRSGRTAFQFVTELAGRAGLAL